MDRFKAVVVIPTFDNETVSNVIKDARAEGYEVIVVDDGSSPELKDIYDEKTHLITHPQNMGKGAALRSGAIKAKELGYSYFVSVDADGQHLPSEIYKLTNGLNDGDDVIIIGARDFDIENVPKGSKIGRAISNFWATLSTSYKITDSLSGFRLYPISILELPVKTTGFEWEIEIIARHAWLKKPIKEITIQCYYPKPENRVSHFKKWKDTTLIVLTQTRLIMSRVFLLKGFM